MTGYPLISDHGMIGNLHTAALVDKDGTIDWFCAPRFDSPSIFASLLDLKRGGRFRIAPVTPSYRVSQMYFPRSACLITRFMTTLESVSWWTSCPSRIRRSSRTLTAS
jgi:GH15 family glucan-1,4-alpha-glucosidase